MPSKWNLKQWLTSNCGLTLTTNRLKNAQVIADIIHRRTGYKIKTRTVHNLLEKQPRTFDSRILQPICDAFRCNLDNFFTVTPSSAPPANLLNDLDLQPRIKPYAIMPWIKFEDGQGNSNQIGQKQDGRIEAFLFCSIDNTWQRT